ncbi:hypothetical protein [Mycobacterium sp. 141]|uniref:hypothetical protein n=1 Tax=Mycobacterium sp. 141 TaxID=1120797 RepID=UPI0018CB7DAF|nr:hypothetical protein [Mycobacterium sp. 141]
MSAVPAGSTVGLPTRSEIEAWRTTDLTNAGAAWRKAATASEDLFGQHRQNIAAPGGTVWEGDAKDAALDRVTNDISVVGSHGTVLREAATLAENGAQDIQAAQRKAVEAITEAEDNGFRVGEDLSVKDTRKVDLANAQARYTAASVHAENIRWTAEQLVQTDSLVGERLHAKAGELEGIRFEGEDDHGAEPDRVQLVDNHFKLDPPPSGPGAPQPPGGWSRDQVMEDAQHIAYGHAWRDHLSDWNGMTQDDLAKVVHDMLTGDPRTDPSLHVGAIPGRSSTAIYKDGIIVIHDPLTGDQGTVYRPVKGFDEFLRLIGGAGAAPVISAPPNLPPTVPHPVENPVPAPAPHAPVAIPPLPADPSRLPPWLANPSPPPMPVSPVGPSVFPNTPLAPPSLGGDLNPGQVSAPAAAAGGLSLAAILGLLLLSPG